MFHAPGLWARLNPWADILFRAIHPLTQTALAFFFVVSGYLLWGKVISIKTYIQVVRKRLQTLVVPFVLWNLIFLVCVRLMFIHLSHTGQVDEFSSLMPGGGIRWQTFDVISFL